MPKVTSLGHMGFYVRDIERSVAFYRDILGLTVSDRSPRGAVFMTAQDRAVEHHELYLAPGRNDDGQVNVLQQISFRCADAQRRQRFLPAVCRQPCADQPRRQPWQHRQHLRQDPDGNSVEVYWPSGVDVPQPFGKPMDLTKSEAEIRAQLNQILTEWASQST